MNAWRPGTVIIQDGAAPHINQALKDLWEEYGALVEDWPGNSPDFNAIEHIWALIRKRVAKHEPVPIRRAELETAWYLEWDRLSLEDINKCILTVPCSIECCIKQRGGNNFHG